MRPTHGRENGAVGFWRCAGSEIIPVLFEITGSFTHDPNPLVSENLAILQKKFAQTKPDLGVGVRWRCGSVHFSHRVGRANWVRSGHGALASNFLKQPQNKERPVGL